MISNNKEIIGGIEVNVTKKTKIKNVYIKVKPPHGDVFVIAPYNFPDYEIRVFVLNKLNLIHKMKKRVLAQSYENYKEYVSGEEIFLWGDIYKLNVIEHKGRFKIKILNQETIDFYIPYNAEQESKEKFFNNWYKKQLAYAMKLIVEKLEAKMNVAANEYRIKNMKTKWGTCNVDKKRIWINLRLTKKPIQCLEYVLVHEMAHLIERNHTKRFYSLINQYMPDWKIIDQIMKKNI
ncbi:M48 family metallopeptidase [Mycoplasma sp. E35C]|uniref:M48 family metallopeptidase n=1 Tax=Mycoplasma sp. E35C TaxID=2801918 RepID=UPI001CA435DD|nr:SprT family zinc-dependent metalloprotease [Mycoplasma sp. E35C]QZX49365.1 M48 family metallopeptidase [Mycoplasma sp. E35C]